MNLVFSYKGRKGAKIVDFGSLSKVGVAKFPHCLPLTGG